MKCDCGVELHIGDWPFCGAHAPMGRFGYDPLDYTDEMIASDPIHFTSRGERIKYMNQHDLEFKPKRKAPGTIFVDLGRK